MPIEGDGLDRDFCTPVRALPDLAKTTLGHDLIRTLDPVSDHQLCWKHSPLCAQALDLMPQIVP